MASIGVGVFSWLDKHPLSPLIVALAAVATILGLTSYILIRQKQNTSLTPFSFITLALASALYIYTSGELSSSAVALWVVIGLISALFGASGLVSIGAIGHSYLLVTLLTKGAIEQSLILPFILIVEVPLLLSFLLWYQRRKKGDSKESSYSALVRELGQVANKSEIVINAIADGVLAIDTHGVIQLINPAAQTIVGWGKQDATGLDYRSVLKLLDGQGKELTDANDPIQRCLMTNTAVVTEEFSLQTTSGKTIMISILVSPVGRLDASGGAIIVFRDITAARAEERSKAEFVSTASHEMRTPVAAIEGYLGLALNPQTAAIDDKARAYLTKAHESAQHLGRLFQDLLDISKAEDGRLKNEPTVIDMVHFIHELCESFRVSAEQKGLSLLFLPTTEDQGFGAHITPAFYTYADADHVREVVSNLIENAIKYTKQGRVTVDIKGDADHVRVLVHDSGIGIPAEDIPHLFQKFYRVDNTDTREIGGTGLGLYLSRRLVEAMNGHLTVESEYGKGSVFTIELPRLSHEDAMQKIEQASLEHP